MAVIMTARSRSYIMGRGPFELEGRKGVRATNRCWIRRGRHCAWPPVNAVAACSKPSQLAVHQNSDRFPAVTCHLPAASGQPDTRDGQRTARCGWR